MPNYARPDSDITVANWSPFPTSPTTRYDKVDETSADDADYVENTANINYTLELGLSDVADPLSSSNHSIRIRNQRTAGGGSATAYLMENGTERASFALTMAAGWTTDSYTLTTGEADSIGNYANLRLRVIGKRCRISWKEFEVPGDIDINKLEAVSLGETIEMLVGACIISLLSAVSVGEATVLASPDFNPSIIEAVSVGEASEVAVPDLALEVSDSATPSDSVEAKVSDLDISVSDSAVPSEDLVSVSKTLNILAADHVLARERITSIWQISVFVGEEVEVEIETPAVGDIDIDDITDSATLSESHDVKISDIEAVASEAVSLGEALEVLLSELEIDILDTLTPSEAIDVLIELLISKLDAVSPGDMVEALVPELWADILEAVSLGESVEASVESPADVNASALDDASPGEALDVALSDLEILTSDSALPSEAIGVLVELLIYELEAVTINEIIEAIVSDLNISKEESVSPSEASDVDIEGLDVDILVSDAVPVKERITNIWQISVHIGEEVNVEIITPDWLGISVSDSVAVLEAIDVLLAELFINILEAVSINEIINVSIESLDLDISVSDSAIPSESSQVETGVVVYDSAYLAEIVNVLIDLNPNILEAVSVGESHTVDVGLPTDINISKEDSAVPAEALDVALSDLKVLISEALSLGEAPNVLIEILISELEAVSISEVVKALVPELDADISESASPSEASDVEINILIFALEALSPGDTVEALVSALNINVSDAPTLAEDSDVTIPDVDEVYLSVSDPATVSEVINVLLSDLAISILEALAFDEAIDIGIDLNIAKEESVSLVDLAVVDIYFEISEIDAISLGESLAVKVSASSIEVSDSVPIAESFDTELDDLEILKSEAISLSEVLEIALSALEVSEFEAITPADSSDVAIPLLPITESEAVSIAEAIEAIVSAPQISASEAITLTENVVVGVSRDLYINILDAVTLGEDSDVLVAGPNLNISASDSVPLGEAVDILLLMYLSPILSTGILEDDLNLVGQLEDNYTIKGEV